MPKRRVFYSFDYDQDVFRVQQIRNMGVLFDNEPVIPTEWEEIKRGGDTAIKNWIDHEMAKCDCVIVLIGSKTHESNWVDYEIKEAFNKQKALLGIHIHNFKDPQTGTCTPGINIFDRYTYQDRRRGLIRRLSADVKCYDPLPCNAYKDVFDNIESLVEDAILRREYTTHGRF